VSDLIGIGIILTLTAGIISILIRIEIDVWPWHPTARARRARDHALLAELIGALDAHVPDAGELADVVPNHRPTALREIA
jgi:hypothetical protein